MKKISFLFFVFILSLSSIGQVVKIKVNNDLPVSQLNVDIPIFGFTSELGFNNKKFILDSAIFNEVDFNNDSGGMYIFHTSGTRFSLLLFPNDVVNINMRINEKDYIVEISGSNAEGHKLWISYDRPRYKKLLPVLAKFDNEKIADNFLPIITNHIDSVVNKISELKENGYITDKYFKAISFYIKDEFGVGLMEYSEKRWINGWDKIEPLFLKYLNYIEAFDTSFAQFKINTLNWYSLSKYSNTVSADLIRNKTMGIYNYIENLPQEMREFAYADIIAFGASRGTEEFNFKDGYTYYKEKYPNGKFIPFLNSYLEPYLKDEKINNEHIFYIDTTKTYSSLKELIKVNFNNKLVFIDLWATWCGPCRNEFSYSNELHEILSKYNIEMLYISIDNARNEKTWKKYVDKGILKGYHYRTGKALYSDIQTKYFAGKSISVPRYILVGSNGIILDNDMPRPSSREVLYNRIKELVSK